MRKSFVLELFVAVQAAVLLVAGAATLWWAQDLMHWLIAMIGEERALGADNVVRLQNGGRLLTNPGAMVRWMVPFWILGTVQMSSAMTMLGLWRKLTRLPSRTCDISTASESPEFSESPGE
jgi:hypothetical protein